MTEFSDFIVFADESGDHGMENINPKFPVFALVLCVFRKDDYKTIVEPAIRQFKFDYFGHDAPILHEREVRKQMPPFDFLRRDSALREGFYENLNALIAGLPVQVIASVIDKERHRRRYTNPWNPYEIAMHFCLETLCDQMAASKQAGKRVHVLMEGRGLAEDSSLELEFRRITQNHSHWGNRRVDFGICEFEPVFVAKAANHAGHQISDLIARPLALRSLRPDQPNRAGEIAWSKVTNYKLFPG